VSYHLASRATKKGDAGLEPPPPPKHPKPKLKKTDFVDTMISNVLRDLPFSRNKPLKSTDDLEF
jgi:hypothetical protein